MHTFFLRHKMPNPFLKAQSHESLVSPNPYPTIHKYRDFPHYTIHSTNSPQTTYKKLYTNRLHILSIAHTLRAPGKYPGRLKQKPLTDDQFLIVYPTLSPGNSGFTGALSSAHFIYALILYPHSEVSSRLKHISPLGISTIAKALSFTSGLIVPWSLS